MTEREEELINIPINELDRAINSVDSTTPMGHIRLLGNILGVEGNID